MGTLNCINSFMRLLPPIKPNQHFKPSLERLSALPCQLPSNCVQSFADAMSRAGIGAPPSNFGGLVSGVWRSAEAWNWRLLWLAHREVFVIWYRPLQIHYILVTHDCRDISWYLYIEGAWITCKFRSPSQFLDSGSRDFQDLEAEACWRHKTITWIRLNAVRETQTLWIRP